MGNIAKIKGVISTSFDFGTLIKFETNFVSVRNHTDTDYLNLRFKSASDYRDGIIYQDLVQHKTIYTVGRQANCSSALPANTSSIGIVVVTTSGSGTNIGDLLYDNGSSSGNMSIISAATGTLINVTTNLTGGSIEFYGLRTYMWEGAWVVLDRPRWAQCSGTTRASTSTFTVTDNTFNQNLFMAGTPLKYGSTPYYGIVKSYSSGTVTVMGVSLPDPLGTVYVGLPEMLYTVTLFAPGNQQVKDDVIYWDTNEIIYFDKPEGWLVGCRAKVKEAALGANFLIQVAKESASTDVFTSTLSLAQSTSYVDTGITASSSNYKFSFLNRIYLNVDQIGSTIPGAELSAKLFFVTG